MSERNIRRHRRVPYNGPVRISWQGTDGLTRYLQGKCVDVSDAGLRMELAEPVPARTLLFFNAERLKLSGAATVRHASRRGTKYMLGLELSSALLERALVRAAEAAQFGHAANA